MRNDVLCRSLSGVNCETAELSLALPKGFCSLCKGRFKERDELHGRLSQSISSVMITYSRKFRGVLESFKLGSLLADSPGCSVEEIISIFEQAYGEKFVMHSMLLRSCRHKSCSA